MTHSPEISVIIPVYNVEKYLEECLNSVTNQSLRDIEIICVNDGSTDGSGKILDEYASKDKRIKVIHKENEGAAPARNIGLDISKGRFVIFFDSDDYMDNNCLEVLYNRAILCDSDITLCRSYQFFDDKPSEITDIKYSILTELLKGKSVFKPTDIAEHIFQFCIGWAWDKLYKKDFILNNKLKFQNLRHSNDIYFVLMSLVFANFISYTDEHLIYHRIHKNSLGNTREKAPESFYYGLSAMYDTLQEKNIYETYRQSFINYCVSFSCWHINTVENFRARAKMIMKYKQLLNKIRFLKYEEQYFYNTKDYQFTSWLYVFNKILKNIFSIKRMTHENVTRLIITFLGIKIKIRK